MQVSFFFKVNRKISAIVINELIEIRILTLIGFYDLITINFERVQKIGYCFYAILEGLIRLLT